MIVLELNIFQKKLENLLEIKNFTPKIYRMQAYDSMMCEYFCIGLIDFMLKGKILLEYSNLFYPNKYKNNDKIMLKCFQ